MTTPAAATDLRVLSGGREFRFAAHEVAVLGRDPAVSVCVPQPAVSRRHAQISQRSGVWVLEDLDSTNGTFVAGQRITSYPIVSAVEISLGTGPGSALLRIEPAQPVASGAAHPTQSLETLNLVLLLVAVAAIGVGVFLLDWVTYDVNVPGVFAGEQGAALDFDAGAASLIAGVISGVIGALGLRGALAPRVVGVLLTVGAALITAFAVTFLLSEIQDVSFEVPGFTVTADASVGPGILVTLLGAVVLAITGLLFIFSNNRSRLGA